MGRRRSSNSSDEAYDNELYLNANRVVSSDPKVIAAVKLILKASDDGRLTMLPISGKNTGIGINGTTGHANHLKAFLPKVGGMALVLVSVKDATPVATADPEGESF